MLTLVAVSLLCSPISASAVSLEPQIVSDESTINENTDSILQDATVVETEETTTSEDWASSDWETESSGKLSDTEEPVVTEGEQEEIPAETEEPEITNTTNETLPKTGISDVVTDIKSAISDWFYNFIKNILGGNDEPL